MPQISTEQRPRTATPSAVPLRVPETRRLVDEALRNLPAAPDRPPRSHRYLPQPVRDLLINLGWWQDPAPQRPSAHIEQVRAVLHRYGWAQNFDFSPTGRMCIRGAQTFLENAHHVTPVDRQRATRYIQQSLTEIGVRIPFHAWNDLPDLTFPAVENRLVRAAHLARKNGE